MPLGSAPEVGVPPKLYPFFTIKSLQGTSKFRHRNQEVLSAVKVQSITP